MTDERESRLSVLVLVLAYWIVPAGCVVLPWVVHFIVAWWAAFPVFFALVALYRQLFVPEGSICMGVPFGLAIGSFLGLVLLDVVLLVQWLVAWLF
jgi:hypothetical protein